MQTSYAERLQLLYALCVSDTNPSASAALDNYAVQDAPNYLACYLTVSAIKQAERSPADERVDNFDMLAVYQAFALMLQAYFVLPLRQPMTQSAQENSAVIIAKSLFAELMPEELAEIVESGMHKYNLIASAEAEHWQAYREDMEKVVVAYVIAGTEDDAPVTRDELIPMLGALLSTLCEAFM